MNSTLLLISSRSEDQAFAQEVAKTSGLVLRQTAQYSEAVQLMADRQAKIIFADTSSEDQYFEFESSVQEKMGLFSDLIDTNSIHFISSEELEEVQYLIQSPLFGNFVLRNYNNPIEAGQHYGRIIRATLEASRDFGQARLLKPNAKIQVVKLLQSSQKQDAVEAIKNYLLAAKFQSRMATVVANAVDELLMNAIFDAPADESGKALLASTSRNTDIKLEGRQTVEMHVGFDGTYVAVTAVDLFGSLDKEKLLSHISKIYRDEQYKVKNSVAGAGIGLATVFRSGGSFLFVTHFGKRTEVTVFFKRADSYREFKDQFRFISTQFYF